MGISHLFNVWHAYILLRRPHRYIYPWEILQRIAPLSNTNRNRSSRNRSIALSRLRGNHLVHLARSPRPSKPGCPSASKRCNWLMNHFKDDNLAGLPSFVDRRVWSGGWGSKGRHETKASFVGQPEQSAPCFSCRDWATRMRQVDFDSPAVMSENSVTSHPE